MFGDWVMSSCLCHAAYAMFQWCLLAPDTSHFEAQIFCSQHKVAAAAAAAAATGWLAIAGPLAHHHGRQHCNLLHHGRGLFLPLAASNGHAALQLLHQRGRWHALPQHLPEAQGWGGCQTTSCRCRGQGSCQVSGCALISSHSRWVAGEAVVSLLPRPCWTCLLITQLTLRQQQILVQTLPTIRCALVATGLIGRPGGPTVVYSSGRREEGRPSLGRCATAIGRASSPSSSFPSFIFPPLIRGVANFAASGSSQAQACRKNEIRVHRPQALPFFPHFLHPWVSCMHHHSVCARLNHRSSQASR